MTVKAHISKEGKIVYPKESIDVMAPYVKSLIERDIRVTILPIEEVDYAKDMLRYYCDIVLPKMHQAYKQKYSSRSLIHTSMMLYIGYGWQGLGEAIKPIEILPIEDMDLVTRVKFITWVVEKGTTEFQIHFPSSNDV